MARKPTTEQWQEQLVDAFKHGEEERTRGLIASLGPRKARALLEALLEDEQGLVRQAAAWGLGELGGEVSSRRLERQLTLEEARKDYDGSAVAEVITQALGRLQTASARVRLVRRLRRLAASQADLSEVNLVARMLWHTRHPALLPVVRQALEQLMPSDPNSLQGLRVLLEKSPEELSAWAHDMSVPVEQKTGVVTVLEEEVPDAWKPVLPALIATAQALRESAARDNAEAAYYCDRLFTLFLLQREQILASLPEAALAALHRVARTLVAATSPACVIGAVSLLEFIGQPEDVPVLEAHRPEDETLAAVFDRTTEALRHRMP